MCKIVTDFAQLVMWGCGQIFYDVRAGAAEIHALSTYNLAYIHKRGKHDDVGI